MHASLFDFHFGCARGAGGHTCCVQTSFLGKIHPRGGEPRKNNIAAGAPSFEMLDCEISEKVASQPFL
jgi:hypothetical protein